MHSNDNSLKSFYSALSTLDEDTLVDTVIIQKDGKNPLTKSNLAEHLANVSIIIFFVQEFELTSNTIT